MKNTDRFFENVKRFQEKRQAIADEFEQTIGELKRYQGSRFYENECEKAKKARETALESLQAEYGVIFTEALEVMAAASNGRKAQALTGEQLRILEVLKMRDTLTEDELIEAANAMRSNPTAIAVLTELGHKSGLRGVARLYNGPMSQATVNDVLESLRHGTADLLRHDVGRAARIAREYRQRVYGDASGVPLPRRKPIETKASCFGQLAGLNPASLDSFCAAVDGGEVDE